MRVFVTSAAGGVLYEFNLPDKYRPGEALGEAEAAALNRLMAENIARNRTTSIRKREDEKVLSVDQLNEITVELTEYAAKYQFVPVMSERRGDIEREAEEVRNYKECSRCTSESLCNSCLQEGRRRVLAKLGIAKRALESL